MLPVVFRRGAGKRSYTGDGDMMRLRHLAVRRTFGVCLLVSTAWICGSALGQSPHLSIVQPGGMPGWPVLTGIENVDSNRVQVIWDGPSGFYQLRTRPSVTGGTWQPVGAPTAARTLEVPVNATQSFFRVVGPAPYYAGSQACAECHPGIHTSELDTRHAHALVTLKNIGQASNASCLPCHTVGFGLPTGFVSETLTPKLGGVQCENCHGPGALHAANPFDASVKPRAELAATVCGGCHQSIPLPAPISRPTLPHYEDWSQSGHARVLDELQADFEGPAGASTFIPTCGRCHSGSVRQAHLNNTTLPNGQEAAAIGIVCATCHDPHQVNVHTNVVSGQVTTNQLRNPTTSLADYHTSGSWATNYNPAINICAQCHNDRNASWQSSSRPPHHSPQYNMLLATVGVLPSNVVPWSATHIGSRFFTNSLKQVIAVTNQCVTCHMQTEEYHAGPPAMAANTGHKFEVESYKACLGCHQPLVEPELGEELMGELVKFTTDYVDAEVNYTKRLLDAWGMSPNVPPEIASYGALAWEYDFAGTLSNPEGSNTIRGPRSSSNPALDEQRYVPEFIKKARFNLYLVDYDGSMGVHNIWHALDLLYYAQDLIADAAGPGLADQIAARRSDQP